jgi:hypothetical protein
MMLLLFVVGAALVAMAFVVSARMTARTAFVDRLGAALAGATGLLVLVTCTLRQDLLPAAVIALIVCAAWFAVAPPAELAQFVDSRRPRQEDA